MWPPLPRSWAYGQEGELAAAWAWPSLRGPYLHFVCISFDELGQDLGLCELGVAIVHDLHGKHSPVEQASWADTFLCCIE